MKPLLKTYCLRYLAVSLIGMAACNSTGTQTTNGSDSGKISVSLVNNPHTANGMDSAAAAMKPTMDFDDTMHNFGAIHQDEVVEHDFTFTNNGKTPLIITSAAGSCGCTIPDYPHDAIAPGKSTVMKVTFNSAGKMGHQEKSVTIHTNTLRNIQMLYIKADVSAKQ